MRDKVKIRFHRPSKSIQATIDVGRRFLQWPCNNLLIAINNLGRGILNRNIQYQELLISDPSVNAYLNHWRFLYSLGMIAEFDVKRRGVSVFAQLPSAQFVLDAIENHRRRLLADTQELVRDPTEYSHRRNKPSEDAEGIVSLHWTVLYLLAIFRLFLRCHYRLLPVPDTGWRRGVKMEMDLLLTLVQPRADWPNCVRQIVEQFKIDLNEDIDVGGFAGPTIGGGGKRPRRSAPQQMKPVDRRPERLLFYFTLPEFVEFRHLYKKNQFDYCLAVFTGDRVVLDTSLNENRLFALKGPIAECLQVATERKRQIPSLPVYQFDAVHDTFGTWKEKVRNWLSQSV